MRANTTPNRIPFTTVWQRIISHSGETFTTARGLPLTYMVYGSYIIPSRTKYNLPRADFEKAWQLMPDVPWSEISKLIRGPSYIKAILTDSRISGEKQDTRQRLFPADPDGKEDPAKGPPPPPPPPLAITSVKQDTQKGKIIAYLLYHAFRNEGIHGQRDMPEDEPPEGVVPGSLDHILFLTLTVSIDYQRDAHDLWDAARATWEDPETRYLFDPVMMNIVPPQRMLRDMGKHRLSKKHSKDAKIWRTVAGSFKRKWEGDPRNFLADCGWDAPTVLQRLKEDRHQADGQIAKDFPYLGGNKIGPLWLRMLRDNAGVSTLRNLDQVPIPVDVHIARASLCLGMVNGSYGGSLEPLFQEIRAAWAESVKGLEVEGRPMIALDIDEPLWHLSKFGCASRDQKTGVCPLKGTCVVGEYCIQGEVQVQPDRVVMQTAPKKEIYHPSDNFDGGNTLCIISCGGKKIWNDNKFAGPTPTRHVYTGNYVKGNQQYAEMFYPENWCILSAKYGFLLPDDIVPEDYNVRMGDPGSVTTAMLQEQRGLKGLMEYDEIVVLGGRDYVDAVMRAYPGMKIRGVFEGLGGIGKQMHAVRDAMRCGVPL